MVKPYFPCQLTIHNIFSDQLPDEHPRKQSTERSLLSRSSDLTKFRLAKVEPQPVVPVRIQSAGPRDWCPPTLQAVKAWAEVQSSEVGTGLEVCVNPFANWKDYHS